MTRNNADLSVGFLFDDTLDNDAGVAQYVKITGGWLARQGHHVDYIVGQSAKTQPSGKVYSAAKNLKVMWAGNRLSISIWPKRRLIKQIIKQNNYDVLHVMSPYSPFMSQVVINKADKQTAVVATWHIFPAGPLSIVGSRLLRLLYGRSFKRIDQHLSVSAAAASYARQAFAVESEVSPNVIELTKFRTSASVKNAPGRIVFLGRLVPRKGCAELIKAVGVLKAGRIKFELVVAGDGPQRPQLEKLVKQLGISDQVRFLGYIDEAAKPELLASAQIACFPSLKAESFGVVLIEAMAAGSGVVLGGDNPGYRTVLGEQPKLLINPSDSQALADRLQELLSDGPASRQLHDWQQESVKQYDIAKVGPELVEIYRRTIAKRQRSL